MTPTAPWIRSLRAGAHAVPLAVDDGSPIADELPGQLAGGRPREELRVLDLLDEDQRLLLRPAPRLVVAREREEDDEPEQHREPGCQHAEDAGRAITVLEEPAFGCSAPHEQERRDPNRGHGRDDQKSPDDVHRRALGVTRFRLDAARRNQELEPATARVGDPHVPPERDRRRRRARAGKEFEREVADLLHLALPRSLWLRKPMAPVEPTSATDDTPISANAFVIVPSSVAAGRSLLCVRDRTAEEGVAFLVHRDSR